MLGARIVTGAVSWPSGRRPCRPLPGLALSLTTLAVASGCAGGFDTLGGREKCWPESDPRVPSLWRGVLRIDALGAQLATPEGDVIPLLPGALVTRVGQDGVGELARDRDVVARTGDDVTLFGGAGGDGALVVCAVEERHLGG